MSVGTEDNRVMLSTDQKNLINRLAVTNENTGMQPASAKVLSLLLVSDEIELSFDQIRETMNLSKSATSNALNGLMRMGHVEYVTKFGHRKRYFRSDVFHWKDHLKRDFEKFRSFGSLLTELLEKRTPETVEFNEKMREVIEFIGFLEDELPKLFHRWESRKD